MKLRTVFCAILAAAATLLLAGYFGGYSRADATVQRLQIVWPKFHQLPDEDRMLLAQLAHGCNLQAQVKDAAVIVGCLQTAAFDLDGPEVSRARRDALSRLIRAAAHELPAPTQPQPGVPYSGARGTSAA